MTVPHASSSGARIVGRMQENMVAYFRLFVGLPGITAADEDVFWFVSTTAEPGNHILRTRIPGASADRRVDVGFGDGEGRL